MLAHASARAVVLGLLSFAMILATSLTSLHATAQTSGLEGAVRLVPALSTVPALDGPFTVYIVVEDLHHLGVISYDDNRDGITDRQISSNGLAAFQFTVHYNSAVLAVGSVERGPELNASGRSFQCLGPVRDPGTLTFGCLSLGDRPDGAQGTLTLAAVEFVPTSPGLSALMLDAQIVGPLGDRAPVDTVGGAVRVTDTSSVKRTPTPPGAQPSPGTVVAPSRTTATPSRPAPVGTTTATAGEAKTAAPVTAATATPSGGAPKPSDLQTKHGSGGDGMWWVIGMGVAVGAAALGMVAVLWHRGNN